MTMRSFGRIGFIGGGNMAEAFVKGLIKGGYPAAEIIISDPSEPRRHFLTERYGIAVTEENLEVVRGCDIIVLAIKPQLVTAVLGAFASEFTADKLLISILAGVATSTLEGILGGTPRVVRAMPNTPALVGEGAAGLCRGRFAGPDDLTYARRLFETFGIVCLVSEEQLDAVTGLSGSGPAYIFTVIEAMADGGVQEGLPRDTALALAIQTVLGAARLLKESGEHPALLRDKVCSPAGTTIAAVQVLEEKGLRATLMAAISCATRRSRELGEKK
jgi:pyrroline-5-carboxylate reductase